MSVSACHNSIINIDVQVNWPKLFQELSVKFTLIFFIHAFFQSETVAVRFMKRAHRPRIASKTITLVSKSILLSFLSILFKQFSQSALA